MSSNAEGTATTDLAQQTRNVAKFYSNNFDQTLFILRKYKKVHKFQVPKNTRAQ